MTAPTPSPETPEQLLEYLVHVHPGKWMPADQLEHIRARDASLTAPLRAEVERLTDRLRDALDRGNRWEKYAHEEETRCSELAAALRPFAASDAEIRKFIGYAPDDVLHDEDQFPNAPRPLTIGDFRAAARALAEGGGE